LAQAEWWRDYIPGNGDFAVLNPSPRKLIYHSKANKLFDDAREETEREYSRAESNGDSASCAVWARAIEQARKLALLYSISQDCEASIISTDATEWAIAFSMRQARFTLERVAGSVASSPFDELCLRFIAKLKDAPKSRLEHSVILKRMKIDSRQFNEVKRTLIERGDICIVQEKTQGRDATFYVQKQG
jgi:hypothetical protein